MKTLLTKGEKVRHRARSEWGIGTITSVDTCGTIRVVFERNHVVSIAKGLNFLAKVNNQDEKVK
jgi:hypothetical protein